MLEALRRAGLAAQDRSYIKVPDADPEMDAARVLLKHMPPRNAARYRVMLADP